LAETCMSW